MHTVRKIHTHSAAQVFTRRFIDVILRCGNVKFSIQKKKKNVKQIVNKWIKGKERKLKLINLYDTQMNDEPT